MKKLYLLLLFSLFGTGSLLAQTTDSMRYQLDQVFANVDKSQVPTRLLDAYALPLVPLTPFNGVLQDSVLLNPDLFRGLYATAYTACIYGSNPLLTLQAFNANVTAAEAAAGPGTVPVMMQQISYATIRPEAQSHNLLTVQNQQLYDVAGRYESPYGLCTLFAAAPIHTYCPSGNVSLLFPSALFTTYRPEQGGRGITQRLEVDFGDGRGYVAAQFDQAISTAYSTAGTKQVKVRYTYQYTTLVYQRAGQTNNIGIAPATPSYVLETRFGLEVGAPASQPPTANATSSTNATTGNNPSVSDSVFFAAQPGQASGWAYIHYANGHSQLTKPLIVAEGFDGFFIAPDIYKQNYSIRNFLREISTSSGPPKFDFRNALDNVGQYDIVFIDYTNGTDDILLNAGLFEAVLTYVNQHKDPSAHEQNVVMGLSMGGNIARYKLADMTKAGRPTDVRLLVLNDSPQRGANIPLGLSALVRQLQLNIGPVNLSDMVAAVKQANLLLDQPATRQLLLYQALGPNDSDFSPNSFIEGPYRQMVAYAAPYKIVAVSQGSQCGTGLFAPYTELVRAGGRLNLYNLPYFLAGSEGVNAEVVVNAIPDNGQAQRVSGLHVYEETQIFFGLINKRSDVTRRNFTCPTGLLPLDGVSGGTEGIGSRLGTTSGVRMGTFQLIKNFYKRPYAVTFSLVDEFAFIPTPSALDIQDFTLPSLSGAYVNGIASVSFSRTDGFLAQERYTPVNSGDSPYNEAHVSFTPRNTEWMFDKMQNDDTKANAVACTSECNSLLITGPSQVCMNAGATTYQVNTTNATWQVDPSGYFTTSSGTITPASNGQFTLTASGMSGPATITVTAANGCSVATLSIHAGEFIEDGVYNVMETGTSGTLVPDIYGSNPVDGPNVDIRILAPYSPGVTYSFSLASSPHSIYQYSYSNANLHFVTGSPGSYSAEVTVTKTSACGTATALYGFSYYYSGYNYTAYPNPANSSFTVTQADSTSSSAQSNLAARGPASSHANSSTASSHANSTHANSSAHSAPYTVRLYDNYGVLQLQQATTTPTVQLTTSGLPTGLYLLHIVEASGTIVARRRMQITH